MHGLSAQLGAAMGLSNAHSHLPPAPRAGAEQGQPPDTCPALGLGEAWLGADEWVALELYEAHSNLLSCQCKQKNHEWKGFGSKCNPCPSRQQQYLRGGSVAFLLPGHKSVL